MRVGIAPSFGGLAVDPPRCYIDVMTDVPRSQPLDATAWLLRDIRLQLGTLLDWRLEVSNNFQKLNTRLDRLDEDVRELKSDMHALQNTVLNFQN